MTIGIYALYWEEPDLVYIGKSEVIEDRTYNHLKLLARNEHYNLQMQNTYNKFGLPIIQILEVCSYSSLNSREIFWVAEFNSLEEGLNIQEPGVQTGSGTKNPNSKHSARTILKIFVYLYKYGLSSHKVSKLTGVPRGTISHISCGKSHQWLREKYPLQYQQMLDSVSNTDKNSTRTTELILVSPVGEIFKVPNLNRFVRENIRIKDISWSSIVRGIQKVISKDKESYYGWTVI